MVQTKMMTMTALTTEPKKVIPLAELSTLEAVFALRMLAPFFLYDSVKLYKAYLVEQHLALMTL